MFDVITVGETMAALAPGDGLPIRSATSYVKSTAGAESNTAIGLAKLGMHVGWFSKLGDDELGDFILHEVRGEGVDTSTVIRDGDHPTGLMLKQHATGLLSEPEVFYYRAGSAASTLAPSDLPEDYLKQAKVIHITGITPALSASAKEMTDELFKFAKANNIMVSFDPNIRLKLWSADQARETLLKYLYQADIVMLGSEEAELLLGTGDPDAVLANIKANGVAKYVAIKQGGKGAVVSDGTNVVSVPPVPVKVLDTVGAGDAFNAGFLYGVLNHLPIEECGEIAGLLGAAAVSAKGDTVGVPSGRHLARFIKHLKPGQYQNYVAR